MQGEKVVPRLLHVGCGGQDKSGLKGFSGPDWTETRFDIDPGVAPDIVGSLTDLSAIESGGVDAIFSSHNVEHLYPHEAPVAFLEFARVLSPDGFAVVTCPDLQAVASFIAEGCLTETLYVSPAGPIAALDILYGHNHSIAAGNAFMAHHTGYTYDSLRKLMEGAGFATFVGLRRPPHFDLWIVAWKANVPEAEARAIARGFLPDIVGDAAAAEAARRRAESAQALNAEGRHAAALGEARAALAIEATNLRALCSGAFALLNLQRFEACLFECERALKLYPGRVELSLNRAAALAGLWRNEEALLVYDDVLRVEPNCARALYCSALMLERLGRKAEARTRIKRAAELDPSEPWLLGASLSGQIAAFDWDGLDVLLDDIDGRVKLGERVVEPFRLLPVCDDPEALMRATKIYVAAKGFPEAGDWPALATARRRDKIRVGYFSSDFRDHPALDLLGEVLALHDRSRFEIHAFSFFRDDSEAQARARSSVDEFHDCDGTTPAALVKLARAQNLDIAVDLNGHTLGAKPIAFATRMAPVQVAYLGYPATTGAPFIDYLIADRIVVPEEERRFYSEKIVSLPHSFQPNDSRRASADDDAARADYGLPERAFVFCCFNAPFKLTPPVFDVWAAILKDVVEALLWIYDGGLVEARDNLRRQALCRSLDPSRLIFAEREPRERHLARHRLADLFLDTSPFNAGATAACALWNGLPVLTCPGRTFSSRYGASLLTAAGLPELIARDFDEYRRIAVALASSPARLAKLKAKLEANLRTAPLFDIPRFVLGLEEAYAQIVARRDAGLAPDHIDVADPASLSPSTGGKTLADA